jgi:hypothetical protein
MGRLPYAALRVKPSLDKRDYRNVGIGQKPVTEKRTYQDLAAIPSVTHANRFSQLLLAPCVGPVYSGNQ